MRRDVSGMGSRTFDVLVVGGGVVGACVARDAAMRGLSVALVEREDFAHATSAASSKLIHGGLRYLKKLELSLVRESLRERRTWEIIAPHLVYPLPFLLPAYAGKNTASLWTLRLGLSLYDLLAFDRNRLDDDAQKLPGHRALSRADALARVPGLEERDLVGAVQYWDCQMHSPERLALSCIVDAVRHGAEVGNRVEVESLLIERGRVHGARVRDRLGGAKIEIDARVVINATGPWADRLLARLPGARGRTRIVRSKGIHIVTRPLTDDLAVAIEHGGGHFFLLPWRGRTLIGTTDVVYDGDPDDFRVTERDIVDFLATINAGFPGAKLRRSDVLHFYGGMRPLVEASPGEDSYQQSRRAEIVEHDRQGGPEGLVSALGGKWTTARALAQQVVDRLGRRLDRKLPRCRTHLEHLPGGDVGTFAGFVDRQASSRPTLPRPQLEHLARAYGTQMDGVLALAEHDASLLRPLGPDRLECGAEIVHAVRDEMAQTLDDVILRRTGLGTLGDPGAGVVEAVAALIAAERGWTDAERDRQIDALRRRFRAEAA